MSYLRNFVLLCLTLSISTCSLFGPSYASLRAKSEIISTNFKKDKKFDFQSGLIVVKAIIKGEEFEFIFDTGASNSILSLEAATALNLKDYGSNAIKDSQGNHQKLSLGLIDTINLGGVLFKNISVNIIDWPENSAIKCIAKDGLIGNNLIRHCNWLIDYKQETLTISDGSLSEGFDIFTPMYYPNSRPRLDVSINQRTIKKVLLDLGSAGNLDISKSLANKLELDLNKLTHIKTLDGASQGLFGNKVDSTTTIKADSISLGPLVMKNSYFTIEKKNGAKIGNRLLKHSLLLLDYTNQQIGFKPYEDEIYLKTKSSYSFSPSLNTNGFYIASIQARGRAHDLGFKFGDKILEFNGKRASDYSSYCDYIHYVYWDLWKESSIRVIMAKDSTKTHEFKKEPLWTN